MNLKLPAGVRAIVGVKGRSITVNGREVHSARTVHGRGYTVIDHPGDYLIVGK